MKNPRQVMLGILVAVLSGVVLLGSVMTALIENGYEIAHGPTFTATINDSEMPTLANLLPGEMTLTALARLVTDTPTATPTILSTCAPNDWIPLVVQPGDTWETLAQSLGTTAQTLKRGNCMGNVDLLNPNLVISVPRLLAATNTLWPSPTPTRCIAQHPGWVYYTVRSGDTLSALARATGVRAIDLQQANCLASAHNIMVGQSLLLPFVPVFTPQPTFPSPPPVSTKITPSATHTPTATEGTPIITETASETPTPTFTSTQTQPPADTETPTPTSTDTLIPSPTDTLAPTSTETQPPTPTETLAAVSTPAPPTPTTGDSLPGDTATPTTLLP